MNEATDALQTRERSRSHSANDRPAPPRDPVLGALRGNHKEFAPRVRQGAVYRRSMFPEDARQMAEELRLRTIEGEALATISCLGTLVGLTPTVVPDVKIATEAWVCSVRPALYIDLQGGCFVYDLDRVLEKAAPSFGTSCIPATRWVRLRLPAFLHDELRRWEARASGAAQLSDLLGRPEWEGRARSTHGAGYRLKPTLARFRRSLGPILLDEGVPALVASAALVDFRLSTKSNFAYVVFPQALIDEALDTLFCALGWD